MKLWTCLVFLVHFSVCEANPGTSFLLAFPQNHHERRNDSAIYCVPETDGTQDIYVALSNGDFSNTENFTHTLTLTNGEPSLVTIPNAMMMPVGSLVKEKHAILLRASDKITVIVRNIGRTNIDSYLAFPISQLGLDHYVLSYPPRARYPYLLSGSFIVVAAVLDGTTVTITLPQQWTEGDSLIYEGVVYGQGGVISVVLQAQSALQLQAGSDLTGSRVQSDRPIGVWSGANATSDHLLVCQSHVLEMMPPVETYGTKYILVTVPADSENQIFRILGKEANTLINVDAFNTDTTTVLFLTSPGDFEDVVSTEYSKFLYVDATAPVIVARYLSASSANRRGDPAMTILTPQDFQYRAEYRIPTFGFTNHESLIVTYVISTSAEAQLTINDELLPSFLTRTTGPVTTHEIANRGDIISRSLTIPTTGNSSVVKLGYAGVASYFGYVDAVTFCEAEGYPLTYKDNTNDLARQAAQDSRQCLMVDDSYKLIHLFQNQPLSSILAIDCCLLRDSEQKCKVIKYAHTCSFRSESRVSSTTHTTSATSMDDCSRQCMRDSNCAGVNYAQTNDVSQRCQFLSGLLGELVNSPPWQYIECQYQMQATPEN